VPRVIVNHLSTPRYTTVLVALMMVQALLGLLWPSAYRDPDWIKATWFGNDWITLLIAAPLMRVSDRQASAAIRAELVWLGTVGYSVYSYAFYLFGAALNGFLPLYVITLGVAIVTLASGLARVDPIAVHRPMQTGVQARLLGGYLVFVACGLSVVWIATWAAYAFAGRPTPVDPNAFKIVAALDLLWLVPTLAAGGTLLWKHRPWGFVLGPAAAVQGGQVTARTVYELCKVASKAPTNTDVYGLTSGGILRHASGCKRAQQHPSESGARQRVLAPSSPLPS
jgi:hypothetical protein